MIWATSCPADTTSAAADSCAANMAARTHHVPRLRRGSAVLIELILAAFIAAYILLVAFGHVLLALAIYKCLRERDGISGHRRRSRIWPQMTASGAEPSLGSGSFPFRLPGGLQRAGPGFGPIGGTCQRAGRRSP